MSPETPTRRGGGSAWRCRRPGRTRARAGASCGGAAADAVHVQLPASLLLAGSFGTAALFLVEEIEGGYLDKLRATPVSRSAIVLGRLVAEGAKALLIATLMVILGLIFGISIASGVLGFLLIGLTALWSVVFVGFMQLVAPKTRSAAATNSAGLVFFPRVTYVMESLRSLVLQDLDWASIWPGFPVVAVAGAAMLALDVRMINRYG